MEINMSKRILLSSVAAVVLICGAPAAIAQSGHEQKVKPGPEMNQQTQPAGPQHESKHHPGVVRKVYAAAERVGAKSNECVKIATKRVMLLADI